jgi:chemotaxis protein MotB
MKHKKKASSGGGGGHDGGGSMRWLLTYADLITLLVAFFVMLYSLSILDLKNFQAVAGALRMNFGGVDKTMPEGGKGVLIPGPAEGEKMPLISAPVVVKSRKNAGHEDEELRRYLREKGLSEHVQVIKNERGIVVRIAADGLLFDKGSAKVKYQAYSVLWKVAEMISDLKNDVRVEGHTCDIPTESERFPSNWELSSMRAAAVVRKLIESGVSPWRLSAAGYGDTRPIAFSNDEKARAANRRVDIVILEEASSPPEPEAAQPQIEPLM